MCDGRINIPFITINLAIIFLFFKPLRARGGSIKKRILGLDLIGCAIFVPAIFMFLLATQLGGQRSVWNSATIIGLFVGAAVMMI